MSMMQYDLKADLKYKKLMKKKADNKKLKAELIEIILRGFPG